jgi:hypothetical protein
VLGGLKDKLFAPELVAEFVRAYLEECFGRKTEIRVTAPSKGNRLGFLSAPLSWAGA